MSIITSNNQRLGNAGKFKAFDWMSKWLCKCHVIDSQNTSDQVMNKEGTNVCDQIAFYAFYLFLVEV